MKQLYSIIQKEDIIGLIQYKDYIQWNTIVLNTKQYKEAYPDNKAVSYLCHLQDNILNESNSTVIR